MKGVEASRDPVDAEALLVPVVGGREEGEGASVRVELGDHACWGQVGEGRSGPRLRGGPQAGRRARPSALRRAARCPGRPGTSAAPARRGAPGWGRGTAPPSRPRERARAPRRGRPGPAPSGERSGTGRRRRPTRERSRSRCPVRRRVRRAGSPGIPPASEARRVLPAREAANHAAADRR